MVSFLILLLYSGCSLCSICNSGSLDSLVQSDCPGFHSNCILVSEWNQLEGYLQGVRDSGDCNAQRPEQGPHGHMLVLASSLLYEEICISPFPGTGNLSLHACWFCSVLGCGGEGVVSANLTTTQYYSKHSASSAPTLSTLTQGATKSNGGNIT